MSLAFIDEVFADFDASLEPFYKHHVLSAIYAAAKRNSPMSQDEDQIVSLEAAPWELRRRKTSTSYWDTFYEPLSYGVREDGSPILRPDVSTAGDLAFRVWADRLGRITHPVMVARYADVLWDLGCILRPTTTRDVRFGQMAVDAYLQVESEHLFHSDIEAVIEVNRALQVALELGDLARISRSAVRLLNMSANSELSALGIWIMPHRAFSESRQIGEPHRRLMIAQLECRLSEAEVALNGHAASAAGRALLQHYKSNVQIDDRHRVLRSISRTFLRQTETVDAMVAIAWLMPIAHLLETEHLLEEAEEIRLAMERRGPESIPRRSFAFSEGRSRPSCDKKNRLKP